MDNSDKNKVDTIADITPVEFKWDETSVSVGIIAQEITDFNNSHFMPTGIASVDLSSSYFANGAVGSTVSFGPSDTFNAGSTEYGKTTIKTARSTIDIDELADMMETLKKRLLILAPNFEMHEKYPMLKELYDEYRAMEALLSGPDSNQ
jgi:hypothetical protein